MIKKELSTKEKLSLIIELSSVLDIIFTDELSDNFDGLELELMHSLVRLCRTLDYPTIIEFENNSK